MADYNPRQEDSTPEVSIDFLDDLLEEMDDEYITKELESTQQKRSSKRGDYFHKIERLREERNLKENLSDYDWDD